MVTEVERQFKEVQFMRDNGTWQTTDYHANNVKTNYLLFRDSKYFDYYRSDTNNMIYRIKKSYMKKVQVLLDEQSWNELEDINKKCGLKPIETFQQYLDKEKENPTYIHIF